MSDFTECPVCKETISEAPHPTQPYTIVSCDEYGNYSSHADLVFELQDDPEIAPAPEVFRAWLAEQTVDPALEAQGPLITAGTVQAMRKRLH